MTTATLADSIRARAQAVQARIAEAARLSGRVAGDVHLIAVTKSQPIEVVQAAIQAGLSVFGENYPEETAGKIAALPRSGVEWHMIGHLQSRKAELVVQHFSMLHSLDGAKLAGRLDRLCTEAGRRLPVLLEFNVGGEANKSGLPAWEESRWPELEPEIGQILSLPKLQVCGLMTMPPFSEDAEQARPYFQRLRRLQEFLAGRFSQAEWKELSMGTSTDYPVAVQEGATYVRVGQAILGPRPH